MPKKNVEIKRIIGQDHTGKSIRKSFYGKNKREAEGKFFNFMRVVEEEKKKASSLLTFTTYAEKWVEIKRSEVSDNTYKQTYLTNLKVLNNAFGTKQLALIKPIDLQAFFSSQSGVSKSKMDKLYMIAAAIFSMAHENEVIPTNPMLRVKKGKSKNPKERISYTKAEYRFVLDFSKSHSYGLGIFIILKTGIRRSELFALKWDNIDFEKRILYINNAVTKENGRYIISDTKTMSSRRQLPLDDEFINHLSAQPKTGEFIIYLGTNPKVIADLDNWTKRRYNPFMLDASEAFSAKNEGELLTRISIHELRHSYGTILYKSGVDIYTISRVLGHSDVKITTDIYIHDDVEDIRNKINFEKLP